MVRSAAALAAAALAVSLLFPTALIAQDPGDEEASQRVGLRGDVVDRVSGAPLEGVSVILASESSDAAPAQVTDDAGRFSFPAVPGGTYELHLARIGYQALSHEVALPEHTQIEIQIELAPEAIELEPIVVEIRRLNFLARRGFYDRQERGLGRFFTRDDIETRAPMRVSDLLRMVPSVRVAPGSLSGGGIVTMRGGCTPSVYLDGARMAPPVPIDEVLMVQDVEAIEVYRGVETPVQFANNRVGGCGSLVIWTRQGNPDEGRPFSWKRLLAAGAFILGATLITQ